MKYISRILDKKNPVSSITVIRQIDMTASKYNPSYRKERISEGYKYKLSSLEKEVPEKSYRNFFEECKKICDKANDINLTEGQDGLTIGDETFGVSFDKKNLIVKITIDDYR